MGTGPCLDIEEKEGGGGDAATTAELHPSDEDLSLGTPVWRHGATGLGANADSEMVLTNRAFPQGLKPIDLIGVVRHG
jgi:hypothetical protein